MRRCLLRRRSPSPASWKLSRAYPVRDYCLQHQESDLAFVERLLAEEGIFYYFDHPSADNLSGAMPSGLGDPGPRRQRGSLSSDRGRELGIEPTLTLRRAEGMRSTLDNDVETFWMRRSVRTNATLLRDYDFRRPLLDQHAQAALQPGDPASGPAGLRVYTHRGEYAGRR